MDARLTSLSIPPYVVCTHLFAFYILRLNFWDPTLQYNRYNRDSTTFEVKCTTVLHSTLLHFYAQTNTEPIFGSSLGFSTLKTKLMRQNWTLQLGMFTINFWTFWLFFIYIRKIHKMSPIYYRFFFLFSPPICFISFGKSANGMEEKLESYLNNPLDNE